MQVDTHQLDPALLKALGFRLTPCVESALGFDSLKVKVDPGLEALGFNQLKVHPLSKFWFQMSTRTPTARCSASPRCPKCTSTSRWGAVQADPDFESTRFQSLIAKRIHSAFNLNPVFFLSLCPLHSGGGFQAEHHPPDQKVYGEAVQARPLGLKGAWFQTFNLKDGKITFNLNLFF